MESEYNFTVKELGDLVEKKKELKEKLIQLVEPKGDNFQVIVIENDPTRNAILKDVLHDLNE